MSESPPNVQAPTPEEIRAYADQHHIELSDAEVEDFEAVIARDERVNYSQIRIIVSTVANDVDRALEALRKRDLIVSNGLYSVAGKRKLC